jgi:23S rRNA (guanine745-N1)-methyltransferase
MTAFVPRTSLACSVRDCGLPLDRRARTFVCPRGHSYDVARSGYANLLQPQDRRSLNAGDSKEAVKARARLLAMGVGRALVDEVVQQVLALSLSERPVVVDLGSGCGDTLAALAAARTIEGIGLDLSTAAAEYAARRFPALTWVVANADRRLPLLDGRVDLVLSLYGRRHPLECARVIARQGFLLVAVPAQDDLIELREFVQGTALARERGAALLVEHESYFALMHRSTVRQRLHLPRTAVLDLLRTTYRGGRTRERVRVTELSSLDVTVASEVFLLAARRS